MDRKFTQSLLICGPCQTGKTTRLPKIAIRINGDYGF